MENTKLVAIVYEDGVPVRAFDKKSCIYHAYGWAHRHYCLEDEGIKPHQLPDYLMIKLHMLTPEEFNNLVK